MADKTSLGDRMKGYENVTCHYLTRRMPVVIRLDGCHFHTFTRGLDKPFDETFVSVMQRTMMYLCQSIQGCVLGYTQSDEISLVLCDYKDIDTEAWFNNRIQKMCSVSASLATLAFNKFWDEEITEMESEDSDAFAVRSAKRRIATFDSRVFNLPKEEVCNYLLWRQQDATRNSIQGLAQSLYSHRELHGLNCNKLQDKMFTEKGVNWNELPTHLKRGTCCKKIFGDRAWVLDMGIPVFSQDRQYVESRIVFDNE